ncbi:MAG: hypothetical protein HFF86_10340 [Oscillibacter sp.]|nr:hypothetical protein [Oscillibacter sp.]
MQITSTTTITTQPPAAMAAISSCMDAMAAFIAATVAFAAPLAVAAAAFVVASAVCTARWVAFTVAWADLWVVLMAFQEERSAVLMVWRVVRSAVFLPERAVLMMVRPPSRTGRVSGSLGLGGLRTAWVGVCRPCPPVYLRRDGARGDAGSPPFAIRWASARFMAAARPCSRTNSCPPCANAWGGCSKVSVG